ncbi:MAG: guanylate kinase [Acidimicrobiia bacterium]|nr:MAG: guanylate kinase [Acidimicrobiia bacterium]
MNASPKGRLIVVSGPSGVGKSSIIDEVVDRTNSRFSVSGTTKSPRQGEVDGVDYHFVTNEAFLDAVDQGLMLEWAEYAGHLYGTPRSEVEPALADGINVILNIEIEGAKQIRRTHPDAVLIFISPPSLDELAKRLAGRGDTAPDDLERRFSVAAREITEAPDVYDHIVQNDALDDAINEVLDILGEEGAGVAIQ